MDHARATTEGHETPAGYLVVLSAPSGGGKTTILQRLLQSNDPDFRYSVSATTRKPRGTERHGREYFFISPEEFQEGIARGRFLEYARVHGNLYGTLRENVEKWLAQGKFVLMDIDVQGGLNIKRQMGERAILIFIRPPSLELLRERLHGRNTDSAEEIAARLRAAEQEMAAAEQYDHVVTNYDLDDTVRQVAEIIARYRRAPAQPAGH
ncbi:MAG: guanylate kinase [candidate division KSB1 bacterium]|nr:guanylate kinase [candidate division KSB1 bacterium]MDZ7275471.1 guanylate kinase [candidate division KSB1 bacterium]MDZ7286217.1 guanylate kinase [candidate division KSB1 bacterium]MDZ7296443.1 guanylate kinase [candidate division KSB1 bacterium]MDZ7307239.1 guanylate kinase [candidate division KSB1 bacterium]